MNHNIIFEKIWQDQNLVELKITAVSEFVKAYQSCYVDDSLIRNITEKISEYTRKPGEACYIEFGSKIGNFRPAFSMYFLPADKLGHVKIEVDVEIEDNDIRAHRCCFYVNGELGSIERLGKELSKVVNGALGEICSLNDMD